MRGLSLVVVAVTALLFSCGPRIPKFDGGEIDAGEDAGVDAGRPRGEDPPTGWATAVELAPDSGTPSRLGVSVASAPDMYGQPLIAGVYDDPNGDGARSDTRVFFTRWNGTDRKYDQPKTVEVVGEVELAAPARQVAIARDVATGRIGIVYVKGTDTIRYAFSDDEGANFSLQTVSNSPGQNVSNPQLALKGDTLSIAYVTAGVKVWFRKRVGTGAFQDLEAPLPAGSATLAPWPVSLQVDSAGNPGLTYFAAMSGLPTTTLVFWRPGSTPTAVADSALAQLSVAGREPSATLAFAGEKPRVAYHLRNVDPLAANDDTPELFFASATDAAGTQWATPVAIPRNGNTTTYHSTRWYQALLADATGKVSLAANFGSNGISGAMCGGPKLAKSNDGLNFTTCSPSQTPFNFAGDWVSLWAHNAAGKLTMVFFYDTRSNPTARPGVVIWREP